MMEKIRSSVIIHVFALLHAVVTWLCWIGGIGDTLILTVLTMVMTVLLCLKKYLSVDFTAIIIVLVNVFGFLLGNWGAALLGRIIPSEIWTHIIATFLTTEILGWGLLLFVHYFPARTGQRQTWKQETGWMVAAVTIVFMMRIGIDLLLSSDNPDTSTLNIIIEIGAFCLVFVVYFAARMRNRADIEREKTHQAEFRYMTLKQQVNPHFLFNSLNILDGLVQEGSDADASRYIHKLAGIYRYMLQHEGERLVRLDEEVRFARMYEELLSVRFPKGFSVRFDIPEEDLQRNVVPCCLQLLIENATKHNAITEEDPLVIRIVSDGRTITVSNNLVPRLSPSRSTGLGHKYIKQQYRDLGGGEILIRNQDNRYSITMPLL